jgi:peroxiredoxin Q/BCP
MVRNLDIGDPAPDFELPTDSGETLRLSDLRGKFVVLYFYPKDDTSGCTAEALDFNRLAPRFAEAGATVVGVSPDSVKSHVKFKSKHGLGLTLAADETHAALEAYGVWKEKSMYGRRFMGVERTTAIVDPEGRIVRLWRKVKVGGHADQALAELAAAQAAFANH